MAQGGRTTVQDRAALGPFESEDRRDPSASISVERGPANAGGVAAEASAAASAEFASAALRASARAGGVANPAVVGRNVAEGRAAVSLIEEFAVSGAGYADIVVALSGTWSLTGPGARGSVSAHLEVFSLGLAGLAAPSLAFEERWSMDLTGSGDLLRPIATSLLVAPGEVLRVAYALAVTAIGERAANGAVSAATVDFSRTAHLAAEGSAGASLSPGDPRLLTTPAFSASTVVAGMPEVVAARPPLPPTVAPVPLPAAALLLPAALAALAAAGRRRPRAR